MQILFNPFKIKTKKNSRSLLLRLFFITSFFLYTGKLDFPVPKISAGQPYGCLNSILSIHIETVRNLFKSQPFQVVSHIADVSESYIIRQISRIRCLDCIDLLLLSVKHFRELVNTLSSLSKLIFKFLNLLLHLELF